MINPAKEELTIVTGGVVLGGWLSSRVTRGVERMPSSFICELTERFPGQVSQAPVQPGASCQIYLSSDLILTGYIDVYRPAYDGERHTVTIAGRSKCEDFVDSAIDGSKPRISWVFTAATVGDAATRIGNLFGITVSKPDGDFAIPLPQTFPISPGLTAYALLEEICRTAGCLLWDDANGNLVISALGTTRAGSALVEGQNVEAAEVTLRMDNRYSDYLVMGQATDLGSGHISTSSTKHDPELPALGRYRVKVIPWEAPDQDQAYSDKRADWEASRRYGRSREARITVTGWRDMADALWYPNTIVHADLPTLKMQGDFAIAEVTWMRGERGTQTVLTIMPQQGLQPEPLIILPAIVGYQNPAPAGG
jgi:prophage tail gpP-like protein